MAFNPFHGFRKHQRALLVALAVTAMFSFILCSGVAGSGRDDFFSVIMSIFGANRRQGDVVTKLYGDKVYSSQLNETMNLRRLADDFVKESLKNSLQDVRKALMAEVLKKQSERDLNPERSPLTETIREVLFEEIALGRFPLTTDVLQAFFFGNEKVAEAFLSPVQRRIQQSLSEGTRSRDLMGRRSKLVAMARYHNSKSMEDDARLDEEMLALTADELWERSATGKKNAFVFGGSPSTQDTLDFLMWQKQADTLGIKLTDHDIRDALNRLMPYHPMLEKDRGESQQVVAQVLARYSHYDTNTLYRALGAELRVCLAHGIILGEEPGMFAFRPNAFRDPLGVTPGQYVDYYQQQRQTASVVLLPVPVNTLNALRNSPLDFWGIVAESDRADAPLTVKSVRSESPADSGGLKPDDVIVKVNDKNVATVRDFNRYFADLGRTIPRVRLEVRRGAGIHKLELPPRESDIRDLYESAKLDEPDPALPTPGFRTPQRVRVQWVSTNKVSKLTFLKASALVPMGGYLRDLEDPREKHYLSQADQQLALMVASSAGLGGTTQSNLPHTILLASRALDTTKQHSHHLSLLTAAENEQAAYNTLRPEFMVPSILQGDPVLSYYSSTNLPSVAASTVGYAAAANVPLGGAGVLMDAQWSAALQAPGSRVALLKEETTKRARIVAGLVAGSISPSLTRPAPWNWASPPPAVRPEHDSVTPFKSDRLTHDAAPVYPYVPLAALQSLVLDRVRHELATKLEEDDVKDFIKKLTEAKGDPDKSRTIIADAITKLKLQNATGESLREDDRFSIAQDAGLAPLRDAFERLPDKLPNAPFAGLFIELRPGMRTPGVYEWMGLPPDFPTMYCWKTKNEQSKVPDLEDSLDPTTGETVRDEVRKAWLLGEARRVTRERAEKEAEAITRAGDALRAVTALLPAAAAQRVVERLFPDGENRGKPIWLDEVSRLKQLPSFRADGSRFADPYRLSKDEVPYPTPTFVDDMLRVDQGKTAIIKDAPEKTYYVAYVVKRTETPTIADALSAENRVAVWSRLDEEQKEQRKKAILEELRRQAGTIDATGHFVLNPSATKKGASEARDD
jgi:hypothetical protein